MDGLVAQVFASRKKRSGAPGLALDLAAMGRRHHRETVAASMRWQGLIARAPKKFKAATDLEHDLPVAPKLARRHRADGCRGPTAFEAQQAA